MTSPETWASRLASAIERELTARQDEVTLETLRPITPDEIEIIFVRLGYTQRYGFRLNANAVSCAPERIRASSLEELAFDIVTTAILEPRAPEDLLPSDEAGVMWLSPAQWIDEIT